MNRDAAQPDHEPTSQWPLLELNGRARDVLAALTERNNEAGTLYTGALRVLADRENPARVRLAAYCLRELLEAFHEKKKGEDLKELVRKLQKSWEVVSRSFGVEPDGDDRSFAQTLNNFFVQFENDNPRRKVRASDTIGRLDPSGRTAPPVVNRARGDAWIEFIDYFNGVLHGGKRPTEESFLSQLEAFERFLLDWLRPQTFADLSEIDNLIAKGPPDG